MNVNGLNANNKDLAPRALSLEKFFQEHKRNKIMKAAEIMAGEYKNNKELTLLTALDGEEFK